MVAVVAVALVAAVVIALLLMRRRRLYPFGAAGNPHATAGSVRRAAPGAAALAARADRAVLAAPCWP